MNAKTYLMLNNNLLFLLERLTKSNNITLDLDETKIQLASHPFYPSINSITDLFNHFDIENVAIEVSVNRETFSQLPDTFLAQIKEVENDRLVVVSKRKDHVKLVFDKKKSKILSLDEFFKLWTGIVVAIEKSEYKIGNESSRVRNFKKIIYTITLAIFVYVFLLGKPTIFQLVHFAISCLGIYISYLIVQHELGLNSKVLDKFCSVQNRRTNCDAVLNSKGATIFGLIKLSDVGLVYFSGLSLTWMMLLFKGSDFTSAILLISTLSIPFTFFSIYYQMKVVKSWCPLCLSVVGLLWVQFGSLFLSSNYPQNLFAIDSSYIYLAAAFILLIALWSIIWPLLKKEQELQRLEIEHNQFKRNFNLFNTVLNSSASITNVSISNLNELVFGNKNENAPLQLMVITNPMCGFCKESHAIVEKLLKRDIPELQIIIRFNVKVDDTDAIGTQIAWRLIELFDTTGEANCLKAFSDNYGAVNGDVWINKWGISSNPKYLSQLKSQKDWCTINKLNFTPALLINGKLYPKEYKRIDLLYFIDDLIDEQVALKNAESTIVNN